MGLFSTVSSAAFAAAGACAPAGPSMQLVFDGTEDPTERSRVNRLGEFFNTPLSALPEPDFDGNLLAWFDLHFPKLKDLAARALPGADREFWSSRGSYAKWREVVRRRIATTLGARAARAVIRARQDGWSDLLPLLEALSKDDGPVHPATLGALRSFADSARIADLDPADLTPGRVRGFLDTLPKFDRVRAVRALKALARLRIFPTIRERLPDAFDISALVPEARTPVPDTVRDMIARMVETARYKEGTYDDISRTTSEAFNDRTAVTYAAALVALARGAAESGAADLDALTNLAPLFADPVRRAVIRHWIDLEAIDAGISARSAAGYVRTIAQMGEANGLDVSKWRTNLVC